AVEQHSRAKGTSKRLPNLSPEELARHAQESGVEELYEYALQSFEPCLKKQTTRSSMRFTGRLGGSTKAVVNLLPLPRDSSRTKGLKYQLYKHRFGTLAGLNEEGAEALMPACRKDWAYVQNDPDWAGYEGFMRAREEIDRLANALTRST
ncbi:MAG: hypothetical protein OXP66_03120, partial [Candidatus Tectomicrobia bacterium]|nr:hypothetical protein [Candidatus Tectomicrobia bacterium]